MGRAILLVDVNSIIGSVVGGVVVLACAFIAYIFFITTKNRNSSQVVSGFIAEYNKFCDQQPPFKLDVLKGKDYSFTTKSYDDVLARVKLENHSVNSWRMGRGMFIFEDIIDTKKIIDKQATSDGKVTLTKSAFIYDGIKHEEFKFNEILGFGVIFNLESKTWLARVLLLNRSDSEVLFALPSFEIMYLLDQIVIALRQ